MGHLEPISQNPDLQMVGGSWNMEPGGHPREHAETSTNKGLSLGPDTNTNTSNFFDGIKKGIGCLLNSLHVKVTKLQAETSLSPYK